VTATDATTTRPSVRSTWRNLAILAAQAIGWVILTVGFIAPLTPSEGRPGWTEVAVWLGTPLLLLGWAAWQARSLAVRALILIEMITMIWLTWRLTPALGGL
jgi:hypothetical protein